MDLSGFIREGKELRTNCDWCHTRGFSQDTGNHMAVNIQKRVGKCWRCGKIVEADVVLEQHMTSTEFFKYKLNGFLDESFFNPPAEVKAKANLFDYDAVSRPISQYDWRYLNYLHGRGISDEEIEKYQLRVGRGRYYGRIMIPTFDTNGNCCYINARALDDNAKNKYINPPESDKSLSLFNINNTYERCVLVVVEGAFSAISAARKLEIFPYVRVVAMYGKTMSQFQAKMIRKIDPIKTLVILDDDCSRRNLDSVVDVLKEEGVRGHSCRIPMGQGDPDECSSELLVKLFMNNIKSMVYEV